jgi:lysophospholipase L1-like esterase
MKSSVRCIILNSISICLLVAVLGSDSAKAQNAGFLADRNGDSSVSVLTFGDSITYGVGDGTNPGDYVEEIEQSGEARGYPQRLSAALSAGVDNGGVPGERFLNDGLIRSTSLIIGSDVDTVVIMEGTNDAIHRIDGRDYRIALQKLINVARAEGKGVVLNTLPPPVAMRAPLALFTTLYSSIIRDLAVVNSVGLADVEQSFRATCPDLDNCQLYNLPEGLHPNSVGYDLIAKVVTETLNR